MRRSRETEPILPTTNMAANNGETKSERKRVLVVGAGAAGTYHRDALISIKLTIE